MPLTLILKTAQSRTGEHWQIWLELLESRTAWWWSKLELGFVSLVLLTSTVLLETSTSPYMALVGSVSISHQFDTGLQSLTLHLKWFSIQ